MTITESNSSIAAIHNIICKRGDTFRREFRYWLDADKTEPLNITTSGFMIDVVDSEGQEVLLFGMASGLTITAPNILVATKTESQMLLPAGTYKYDIQKTLSDGTVITIMQGKFIIENDITG